jgi:peroxiredoxin
MPYFQRIADEYAKDGFVILAVNNREPVPTYKPFLDELKITFPVGSDPAGKINTLYRVANYPSSYIIGRDGKILARQFGPFPEALFVTALQEWLKQP